MKELFENFPVNKKLGIGLLLVMVAALIFVSKDAFLYKETIAKITTVENVFSHEAEGPNEEIEKYYDQEMTASVLNGKYKGKEITLKNTYSSSGINDERYYKGDQVFVSLTGDGDYGSIMGKKRDVYLALLLGVFLFLLFYINRKHGCMIFFSLLMNLTVFSLALWRYKEGVDMVAVAFVMMVMFSILTLLFAGGFYKKTLVALISTLVTTMLCYGIYEVALLANDRLPYEMMEYAVNPNDLSDLFLTGILMGSLGAVMDVCISIAASVTEIKETSPDITLKALIKSIREMGYDIMGTMINVLFFTYISGTIPIVIVKINNGYTLYHLIHFHLIFEIIRFLMGAIGIVLAIPVTGFFSVLLLHKKSVGERGNEK